MPVPQVVRAGSARPLHLVHGRSVGERIRRTLVFEAIGLVVVTPAYRAASGATLFDSMTLMLAVGMLGALWCVVFDALFERIEQSTRARAGGGSRHGVRLLHAVVREATQVPVTLPVIYGLTQMNWRDALMTDLALAGVYVVYGFLFFSVANRLHPAGLVAVVSADR